MWQLRRFLKPYKMSVILAPLFMVLEVYMDLLQPKYMADIVNQGVLGHNVHVIQSTGLWMIGLALIGFFAGAGCNVFASIASQNFGADVREAVFSKVQTFSFRNLDRFSTGSLVTRMTNDIVQLQNLVQMALQILVRAPLLAIGSIFMALTISMRLGTILLVAVPILVVILIILIRYSYPLFGKVQAKLDAVNTVLQENLAGIRVVKAFVRAGYEITRFGRANDDYTGVAIKASRIMAMTMPMMMLIMNLSIVAVLWYGGYQVWAGSVQVGDLIAFINYVTQVLFSLLMVSMIMVNISQAKVSADRVTQVLSTEPEIVSEDRALKDVIAKGHVIFDGVWFSYGHAKDEEWVLEDIRLDAHPGELVAIIGSTGSGKSTLVNLIARLYDATKGRILIDGVDIREMDLHHLRSQIGFVLQESILFSGSILDNIRFGRPDAPIEKVEAVAKAAQAHDFISSMPDGYDTQIGQRGVNLSGGQKQRLAIARALLVSPPILVLDDSTSALDVGTEARLQAALRQLRRTSTTFLIAQRISSVIDAQQIIVLEDGQVVGEGTHEELMETCVVYQDIYDSQLGREVAVHG